VQHNPKHHAAWHNLGVCMTAAGETVAIDGKTYTKGDCYAKALEADASDASTWLALSSTLDGDARVTVNGTSVARRECLVRALEIDPNLSSAWSAIGLHLNERERITINGVTFDRSMCLQRV
jgi:hypothetical protein